MFEKLKKRLANKVQTKKDREAEVLYAEGFKWAMEELFLKDTSVAEVDSYYFGRTKSMFDAGADHAIKCFTEPGKTIQHYQENQVGYANVIEAMNPLRWHLNNMLERTFGYPIEEHQDAARAALNLAEQRLKELNK